LVSARLKAVSPTGDSSQRILCGTQRCGVELGVFEPHVDYRRTAKAQKISLLPGFVGKRIKDRTIYELTARAARWYRETLRRAGEGQLRNGKATNAPRSFARRPIPTRVAEQARIQAMFEAQRIQLRKMGLEMPELVSNEPLCEETERLEIPSQTFVRCPKCRALNYIDFWPDPDSEYSGGPIVAARIPQRQVAAWFLPEGGELNADQKKWYDALAAIGVEVHAWRPSDWPEIVALLSEDGGGPNLGLPEEFVRAAEERGLKPTVIADHAVPEAARRYFEGLAKS